MDGVKLPYLIKSVECFPPPTQLVFLRLQTKTQTEQIYGSIEFAPEDLIKLDLPIHYLFFFCLNDY